MAKALTFIFTLIAGSLIGILASSSPHDRPGGAFVGLILSIPIVICALWIWQGADRHEDMRWTERKRRHDSEHRPL